MNKKMYLPIIAVFCLLIAVFVVTKNNNKIVENEESALGDSNKIGDINGDGKVNTQDYVLLRKHILKQSTLSSGKLKKADIDGNGKVNASDFVKLRKKIIDSKDYSASNDSNGSGSSSNNNNSGSYPQVKYLEKTYEVVDFNVVDLGADPSGNNDSTAAFKKALDAAGRCANHNSKGCGSVIYIPNGKYKLTDTISMPAYVELLGESRDGVILEIRHNKGNEDPFKSAVRMEAMSSIKNVSFHYPEQNNASNIVKYPPTLVFYNSAGNGAGDGVSVKNVRFINSYIAMDFSRRYGVNKNNENVSFQGSSIHFISDIYGTPLKTGIINDTNLDTIRIENIEFSPKYWKNYSRVDASSYLKSNATGIIFRRVDWYYLSKITITGYNIGIYLDNNNIDTAQYGGNPEGEIFGSSITNCKYPIKIKESRHMAITNTTLKSSNGNALDINTSKRTNYSIYGSTIETNGAYSINQNSQGVMAVTSSTISGIVNRNSTGRISFINTTGSDANINYPYGKVDVKIDDVNPIGPKSMELRVVETSNKDITTSLQKQIDDLKSTGGIVYIPSGIYTISSQIIVHPGVEVRGSNSWMHANRINKGTIIKTKLKSDSLFVLKGSAGLNGFAIFPVNDVAYLNYKDNENTPYIIKAQEGNNNYIININITGAYNGIRISGANHYVGNIWGEFYNRGIFVEGTSAGTIKNIHITPNVLDSDIYDCSDDSCKSTRKSDANSNARQNQKTVLVHNSGERLYHLFSFGAQVAYTFDGASNFSAIGIAADATGIDANITNNSSGKIVNSMFVSRSYNFGIREAKDSRHYYFNNNKGSSIDIINAMNWGNNNAISYDINNSKNIRFISGVVEDISSASDKPPVRINGSTDIVLSGIIFRPTEKEVFQINNSSGIKMHGDVCWNANDYINCYHTSSNVEYANPVYPTQKDVSQEHWENLLLVKTSATRTEGKTTICNLGNYKKIHYTGANEQWKSSDIKEMELSSRNGNQLVKYKSRCAEISIPAASGQVLKYKFENDGGQTSVYTIKNIGKYFIYGQEYNYFLYKSSNSALIAASNNKENLTHWVNQPGAVSANVKSISNNCLSTDKYPTHKEFVEYAYKGILGRSGDTSGINHWTELITNGSKKREDVVNSILITDEAKAIYKSWGYN